MDFETHPVGTAAKLAALEYDTPEAIAINDKAARELLEVEKLKGVNAELIEALQLCANVCAGHTSSKSGLIAALEAAKAAIAKALGETK